MRKMTFRRLYPASSAMQLFLLAVMTYTTYILGYSYSISFNQHHHARDMMEYGTTHSQGQSHIIPRLSSQNPSINLNIQEMEMKSDQEVSIDDIEISSHLPYRRLILNELSKSSALPALQNSKNELIERRIDLSSDNRLSKVIDTSNTHDVYMETIKNERDEARGRTKILESRLAVMEAAYLKERSSRIALEKEIKELEKQLNVTMASNISLQNEIHRFEAKMNILTLALRQQRDANQREKQVTNIPIQQADTSEILKELQNIKSMVLNLETSLEATVVEAIHNYIDQSNDNRETSSDSQTNDRPSIYTTEIHARENDMPQDQVIIPPFEESRGEIEKEMIAVEGEDIAGSTNVKASEIETLEEPVVVEETSLIHRPYLIATEIPQKEEENLAKKDDNITGKIAIKMLDILNFTKTLVGLGTSHDKMTIARQSIRGIDLKAMLKSNLPFFRPPIVDATTNESLI